MLRFLFLFSKYNLHIKKIMIESINKEMINITKYYKSILSPYSDNIILQIVFKLTSIKYIRILLNEPKRNN